MDLPAFIGWLLATLLISIGVCREIHFRICRRRPLVVQAEQIHTTGMRGDSLGLYRCKVGKAHLLAKIDIDEECRLVEITGRLADLDGKPLSQKRLCLVVDGSPKADASTDKSGSFLFDAQVGVEFVVRICDRDGIVDVALLELPPEMLSGAHCGR